MAKLKQPDLPRIVVPMPQQEFDATKEFFEKDRRAVAVEVRRILAAYRSSAKVRTAVDEASK